MRATQAPATIPCSRVLSLSKRAAMFCQYLRMSSAPRTARHAGSDRELHKAQALREVALRYRLARLRGCGGRLRQANLDFLSEHAQVANLPAFENLLAAEPAKVIEQHLGA